MPLLFVYGTLRDPDILAGVLGRPLRAEAMQPASAPGFRAVYYPGRVYPGLIRSPGGVAEGLLLTDLSAFEFDLLDAFEGDEYRRDIIAVMADEELHETLAYLPTIAIDAGATNWTLREWQAKHKPAALDTERSNAAQLRAKLIAIRPN
ncbi:MAG: gamma-glutamylcyclotransferase family protein [Devosia sp.]